MLITENHNSYQTKRGKYISIKPAEKERYVRIKTLGLEYMEESIIRRIKNKNLEFKFLHSRNANQTKNAPSRTPINQYKGIQLKYVSLIRLLAELILNGKKTDCRKHNINKPYCRENDFHINQLVEQLRLLNKENITTESELEQKYDEIRVAYSNATDTINKLKQKAKIFNGLLENIELTEKYKLSPPSSLVDKAKFLSAKSALSKYNGNTDLATIRIENEKVTARNNDLQNEYLAIRKRYKTFELIYIDYQKISNDTYWDGILRIVPEKNNSIEILRKANDARNKSNNQVDIHSFNRNTTTR